MLLLLCGAVFSGHVHPRLFGAVWSPPLCNRAGPDLASSGEACGADLERVEGLAGEFEVGAESLAAQAFDVVSRH
jgi:hypothetical protein